MTKRVSLETIKKEFESTRKLHSAILSNGEEIRYYAKFSENKINKLIKELADMIQESEKQDIDFFNKDERLFQFSYFLVIKYFTDLGKEFPDDYEESILLFNKMIEIGLFTEIIEALPMEEVGKVIDRLIDKSNTMMRIWEEEQKTLEKINNLKK